MAQHRRASVGGPPEPFHVAAPRSRPQAASRLRRKLDRARGRAARGRGRARGAGERPARARLCGRRRVGGSQESDRPCRSPVHIGRSARTWPHGGARFPRPLRERAAIRDRTRVGSRGDTQSTDEFVVTDLRSIAVRGLVEAEHLPPLAEGKALLNWHGRHRFCPNCGAATNLVEAGWRRDCPSCRAQHFPRTDPVVIMLAVAGERCVLGRSYRFQPGMWSCLAGFVEPGEAIEDAVRRETREEAGIVCGRVRYFASQPWPFPTSLMIGCHAEALSHEIVIDRAELDDARWFDREEVASMLLRCHPGGLTTPPTMAIAYHIIRAWVEEEVSFN